MVKQSFLSVIGKNLLQSIIFAFCLYITVKITIDLFHTEMFIPKPLPKMNYVDWLETYSAWGTYAALPLSCFIWGIFARSFFYTQCEQKMRAAVLFEILQSPPEQRSDRVLDLCFFAVANSIEPPKGFADINDEMFEYLQRKIDDKSPVSPLKKHGLFPLTGFERTVFKAGLKLSGGTRQVVDNTIECDIPTKHSPKGFPRSLLRVQDRIDKHNMEKMEAEKMAEEAGNTCVKELGLTSVEPDVKRDLEKGLDSGCI